jgi:hypothetical protein
MCVCVCVSVDVCHMNQFVECMSKQINKRRFKLQHAYSDRFIAVTNAEISLSVHVSDALCMTSDG